MFPDGEREREQKDEKSKQPPAYRAHSKIPTHPPYPRRPGRRYRRRGQRDARRVVPEGETRLSAFQVLGAQVCSLDPLTCMAEDKTSVVAYLINMS